MRIGILIMLTILLGGCRTTSKVNTVKTVSENFKDVYILSILIRDHFRNTREEALNLDELIQHDTLRRISNILKKSN